MWQHVYSAEENSTPGEPVPTCSNAHLMLSPFQILWWEGLWHFIPTMRYRSSIINRVRMQRIHPGRNQLNHAHHTLIICFQTNCFNLFTMHTDLLSNIHDILVRCTRKQHWRVTISRWPGMVWSIGAQTLQELPAVDYGVGREVESSSEQGQLDKARPVNYTQVKYTRSGAPILKLTLSVIKHAEVTTVLQGMTTDWNSAPHWMTYTFM